jgi:DNA polymerase-3 subunit alpha/error-prone DNA polymerase
VRGWQAAVRPSHFDASEIAQTVRLESQPFQYIVGAELTPFDTQPLIALPMNREGYRRLSHLITAAKRPAPKGAIRLSLQMVLDSSDDLLLFPLPPWREDQLLLMQATLGDRLALPVSRDLTWESLSHTRQAFELEAKHGFTLFATQRPLFHSAERKPLHDVMTCILHGTSLGRAAHHLTQNRERHLKSVHELSRLFRDRPDLLTRTLEVARRAQFSLSELRYRYPRENLPPEISASDHLRHLVETGLQWRYGKLTNPDFMVKVRAQVDRELGLIADLEYEDYFLTLYDICQFAKRRGILHHGRGSAANSVVCFALGLTSVDPIKLGLLFERFISRERGEPPDIDIDFEHQRREEVIQYIYEKYGEQNAAMVCTVIRYRSRMAIREVAKVLGVPNDQVNHLVKYMGREGISRLLTDTPELQRKRAEYGLQTGTFQTLVQMAHQLMGFPRHLGIHTGGFVIAHEPVIDIVPVEAATMTRRFVVQWNKDDINDLGMMKIDILSLGMLTAVRRTLDLLREHRKIDWNLAQIPHGDPGTYQMIQKADTIGVFQIESRAQMSLLPRLKPANFYDLVVEVAIVRPGPIQGGMVHPFLRRRAGQEKVDYMHPALVPVLKKTLGVPLFQEQIMQIAVAVAGFTPGEADELRRLMSSAWKKKRVMEGLRQRVINGLLANGVRREDGEKIYRTIEGFSSYGFPESHAASFALITYASCYLKHHHPDLFVCALLNSQPMGFYSPRQLIADAQKHGVVFRPLDVQASDWEAKIEPHAFVRIGFNSVFGLNEAQMQRLVEERRANGSFASIADLARRTGLPRPTLLRLAAAGALASLGTPSHQARQNSPSSHPTLSTREALWLVQGLELDPLSLFVGSWPLHELSETPDNGAAGDVHLPEASEWESVQMEYTTKGFSITTHPLLVLRPELNAQSPRFVTTRDLEKLRHRSPIRMAGLMSLMQKPPTAKGVCFLSLEDETGIFNVVLMPDVYQKYRLVLGQSPLLEIRGHLESVQGVRNVRAESIRVLDLKQKAPALGVYRDLGPSR